MKLQHVRPFIAAFPEADYYLSEAAIRDSMRRRFPFNVIQTKTGAKADIIPLPDDVFSRIAFNRRRKMAYRGDGQEAYFISAEDVILAKLFTFAETQSDKHLRDIRGVLVTQWGELNLALIRRAADHRGLLDQFEQIYEAARQEVED